MGGLRIRLGAQAPTPISIAIARAQLALTGRSVGLAVTGLPFITTFPLTENPISQSGVFLNGLADGLDWNNVKTTAGTPGTALATVFSAGFDDCVCCLKPSVGVSTTKHYAQVTVSRQAGYVNSASHEIEVLLAWSIAGHSISGYEMDFSLGGNVVAVRWNGALNDFTPNGNALSNSGAAKPWLDVPTGAGFVNPVDGDVLKFTFDSSGGSPLITGYQNGAQVFQVADTSLFKILSGNCGFGCFIRTGAGQDATKFCVKRFEAGNA